MKFLGLTFLLITGISTASELPVGHFKVDCMNSDSTTVFIFPGGSTNRRIMLQLGQFKSDLVEVKNQFLTCDGCDSAYASLNISNGGPYTLGERGRSCSG